MKNYFASLLLLYGIACFGQGENNTWYFGNQCGLDFNSGSPVALTNGQTNQWEGVATISDSAGNLLFYTDGMTVWNSNHLIMPNGTGLLGDYSSTHSATIVRNPGSAAQYYIFTCPAFGSFCYSIVDMTLGGGLGDLTIKNSPLHAQSSEKCVAVYKPGTSDVWVIGHNTDTVFYSYLVTSAGVSAPLQSYHSIPPCSYAVGYIKASPGGNKIAAAIYCSVNSSDFAMYDFDCNSGILSNEIKISIGNPDGIYALEFSPDGTKLYAIPWMLSGSTTIYQYDITLGSAAAIAASKDSIGSISHPGVGDAQIGPDQKIYIVKNGEDSLSVINNPNLPGPSCGLVENAVYLGGKTSGIGLPSSIRSTCGVPQAIFTAPNHICPGTCADFTNLSLNATSYLWTFTGGVPASSTDASPLNICYSTPGTYAVTLIASNAISSDTLTLNNFITVYPSPPPQGINQSGDTLFANAGAISYQWYFNGSIISGATDYFYVATSSGNYNVVATDANGCEVEAVIFDVIASVQLAISSGQWVIFPNPAGDKITIQKSEVTSETAVTISIYNTIGAMVLAASLPSVLSPLSSELDVRTLPPGMYWIEIAGSVKIFRSKFVKE